MKNDTKAKKWLIKLVAMIIVLLGSLMLFAYKVDPYLYYRVDDNKYFLNSRFVNKGLVSNSDYDTIIIGSSMIQNFNMQSFRDKLGYSPLKATIGGMRLSEMELMNRLALQNTELKRIIINLDLPQFNNVEEENRFPDYLYDDSILNDYKYLLGYETWMRFIPVDIAINTLHQLDFPMPQKVVYTTEPDLIENWSQDYKFGKEIVIQHYLKGETVSRQDKTNMYNNMCYNFDAFILELSINTEYEYIFLFPPYSALYWYHIELEEYQDIILDFKEYAIEELLKYPNIRIVDMQDLEYISDLDHYKDLTHYDPFIQELIIDSIDDGLFDINDSNFISKRNNMLNIIEEFKIQNIEWIN